MSQIQTVDDSIKLPTVIHKKRSIGRPSTYNDNLLRAAKEYLANFSDNGALLPSNEGLALNIGISRTCLYEWKNDKTKAEFQDILSTIKLMRHELLTNGGLSGQLNPAITKLMLLREGYHENSQGNQGVSINIQINRDGSGVTIEGETE